MKKKLILIGICLAIIVVVFTVNVIRRMQQGPKQDEADQVREEVISRAEAYRLLSYLEYDRTQRLALPQKISYASPDMSGWYDSYVNAAWKMGLIEENIVKTPKAALTYAACKVMIDKLIMAHPEYQDIYSGLSFDFMKAEEDMLIVDFLELYQAILSAIPKEDNPIVEETLFVLGRELSEDGKERMVTDQGKYYYQEAKNYEKQYEGLLKENTHETDSNLDETKETSQKDSQEAMGDNIISDEAKMITVDMIVKQYQDKGIKVLVRGQEIIYVTKVTTEKIVLRNTWIQKGKDERVDAFVGGLKRSFAAKFPLSNEIQKVVGDIYIENQKVVQISVKPEVIQGKVLQTGEDFIEIEGYGKVPLDEDFHIYKLYGELSLEPTESILVGYETTDFIVAGGYISAALIKESIKAENIRVLLKTTDFQGIYHNKVEFTSNEDFIVSNKEDRISYKAGDVVTVVPGHELLSDGRIKIETATKEGKIQILSIVRSKVNPKYRGTLEISEDEKGLLIVNDLPLEEYLYAVIPSEMPTYYGMEPLKVQAVCARSYAYKHLMANSLSEYGAHVDDSVSYQVYNNISENEESILAVKDTYGKVIEYNGEIITAYYFSTSCGHTTGVEYVWANGEPTPYLSGRLMAVEKEVNSSEQYVEAMNSYQDLTIEENFRSFIQSNEFPTYDSIYNWYRWKVTIDAKDIKKVLEDKLSARYQANPNLILTMTEKASDGKEAVYESLPIETLGDIKEIKVLKRGTGGIVTELLIVGSKNTIKVMTEYNIRVLLSPKNTVLIRNDQSEVANQSLLPSAFIALDNNVEDSKLKSITIYGGGYGHGVGMSQNGVKSMADEGKEYEEIVAYFYQGTELGFIYE